MKNSYVYSLLFCLLLQAASYAQSVGVGTISPDTTSAFEVRSVSKGMLIPRVSTAQRIAILNPVRGLMVFDSTVNAFYFYNGGWTVVGDNLGNHTATQNIDVNGHFISNNGANNGLSLDNSGNATISGKITASNAAITTGGNQFDFLTKNTAGGDVGYRKGFGAVGINYIISMTGIFPGTGSSTTTYSLNILGEIRVFAGNFAPSGWAFCNGQLLSTTTYAALYNILGTTYGGDGVNTFALPDLRGAVPVSPGTAPAGYIWVQGAKVN